MENLFPGMEAFMEGDVEVEVNVGAPAPEEVVEEAETAADEQAEVVEATDEAEDVAEQAEEMFARFDEVDRMIAHVQTYGVDRSFLSLMNYNDRLSKTFGIQLPACESFDAVGSPRSAESIACLEGLKEIAGKVWAFIKAVCSKIASYAARFVEAIRVRIGSIDGNIGRLRKALANRVDKPADQIKDVKIKIASIDDLQNKIKVINAAPDKAAADMVAGLMAKVGTEINQADIEKAGKAIEGIKIDSKKVEAKETDVSGAASRAAAYLDLAASTRKAVDEATAVMKICQKGADQGVKMAKAAEARKDVGSENVVKTAKAAVKLLNKLSSIEGKLLGALNTVASQSVKAASQLIVRGTEKKK